MCLLLAFASVLTCLRLKMRQDAITQSTRATCSAGGARSSAFRCANCCRSSTWHVNSKEIYKTEEPFLAIKADKTLWFLQQSCDFSTNVRRKQQSSVLVSPNLLKGKRVRSLSKQTEETHSVCRTRMNILVSKSTSYTNWRVLIPGL